MCAFECDGATMCNCNSPLIKWKWLWSGVCSAETPEWAANTFHSPALFIAAARRRLCTFYRTLLPSIHLSARLLFLNGKPTNNNEQQRNWKFLWPLKNGSWRMGSNNHMHISCSLFWGGKILIWLPRAGLLTAFFFFLSINWYEFQYKTFKEKKNKFFFR